MGYRVLLIENESTIKLQLDSLIINNGEGDIYMPIKDLSMLLIDNLKTTITSRMMSKLAENNVGVIFCNNEHMPIGFYSSYDNHSRISKNLIFQIKKERFFYDNLWIEIVKNKIINQIKVLKKVNDDMEQIGILKSYIDNIEPGDITNREAHAAKVYFNCMFGKGFSRRDEENVFNHALNYGYAIIRSLLAKLCVSYGLNTQLAIHHRNEFNRFNLVDDLIEPFRPFVDYHIFNLMQESEYFTVESREKIVNILNHKIEYNNKKMYIQNAIEEYVQMYSSLILNKSIIFIFPDFDKYIGE